MGVLFPQGGPERVNKGGQYINRRGSIFLFMGTTFGLRHTLFSAAEAVPPSEVASLTQTLTLTTGRGMIRHVPIQKPG